MDDLNSFANPENFQWHGSIIHGFDEDELGRLAKLRKKLRSALSRRKRTEVSKKQLIGLKKTLDNQANQQLLQLDLYTAAMKYDRRNLSTENIGIAASIEEITNQKTSNENNFNTFIRQKKEELEGIEKLKKAALDKETERLAAESQKKLAEALRLENEAKRIKMESNQRKEELMKFQKYKEWQKLNAEYFEITKKRERLEREAERSQQSHQLQQSQQLQQNEQRNQPTDDYNRQNTTNNPNESRRKPYSPADIYSNSGLFEKRNQRYYRRPFF